MRFEDTRLKKLRNWAKIAQKWQEEYRINLENIMADWGDYTDDERYRSELCLTRNWKRVFKCVMEEIRFEKCHRYSSLTRKWQVYVFFF